MSEEYILIMPIKNSGIEAPMRKLKIGTPLPTGWRKVNTIHNVPVTENGHLRPIFKSLKVWEGYKEEE